MEDGVDFDRDSCDPYSANAAAAGVIRQLATQLEQASFRARYLRSNIGDSTDRARRIDFALAHLASVMSEPEVTGLVNALRHAATSTQEVYWCEFCGAQIQPWSMLIGDPDLADESDHSLTHHTWDQYGTTLCKSCHFIVRKAQWQLSTPM